tara:strand:+ start:487 stop:1047 length:561 start_codon:yes stop_codon:yes gene_type:complete
MSMSTQYHKSRGGTGKVAVKCNALNAEIIKIADANKQLTDILVVAKDHWMNNQVIMENEKKVFELEKASLKEQLKLVHEAFTPYRKKNEELQEKLDLVHEASLQMKDLIKHNSNSFKESEIENEKLKKENDKMTSMLTHNYNSFKESERENEKLKKDIEEMLAVLHGYKQNLVNNTNTSGYYPEHA